MQVVNFDADESPMRVKEVASQVLRLRALKRQHDEYTEQFSKAEHQLKRTPTHYFLLLQSFLEKHLSEPMLAAQLQQPFAQLIKGLAAACRVELELQSSDDLLGCSRQLFRDAYNFANKLIRQQMLTPQEAKYLAPCLLSGQKYKRVREKEVNACFEVLSEWLSALYFYAGVASQVVVVAWELEEKEALLCQLGGSSWATSSDLGAHDAAPARLSATSSMGPPEAWAAGQRRRDPLGSAPGSPEAGHRSTMAERSSAPPVRRNSAGSPTGRSARTGSSAGTQSTPGLPRAGGATGFANGGVQRMQSDKVLTQVLKAIKEGRVQSPESSPVSRSSGGATPSSPIPRSSSRPLNGGLPVVPERCVSLPSTLLESMYGAPRGSKYTPGVNRRVTAVPKLQ